MAQLSCLFATNCRAQCYFFSRWAGGLCTAYTPNSWVYSIKERLRDVHVLQTYVLSEKLTLANIGLFGDYEGHDFTICPKYCAQVGVRFSPSSLYMPVTSS